MSHLIEVDSAGTHAYHVGNPPDLRSQETAMKRGLDISSQRARQAVAEDFHDFDYLLAMDQDNYRLLSAICPGGKEDRLQLFMDYAPELNIHEVPDPYYGGSGGFDRVFDMVETAAAGLLEEIKQQHK